MGDAVIDSEHKEDHKHDLDAENTMRRPGTSKSGGFINETSQYQPITTTRNHSNYTSTSQPS